MVQRNTTGYEKTKFSSSQALYRAYQEPTTKMVLKVVEGRRLHDVEETTSYTPARTRPAQTPAGSLSDRRRLPGVRKQPGNTLMYYIIHYTLLHCIIFYSTILYYTIQYCTILC